MDKTIYINYNGNLIAESENIFNSKNRAFRYGDGIFETIRALGTKPLFINRHYERMFYGIKTLKMQVPSYFTIDFITHEIERTLNKNRHYKGARVRFQVFRNAGGFYSPDINQCSFIIETATLENEQYELNKKGYKIDIFTDIKKPATELSNLKTCNALPFIMAGIFKQQSNLDEVVLINNNYNIVETICSNLFFVRNNKIFTPSLTCGCVAGIMRNIIIELALKEGYSVFDECLATQHDLLLADEIFLTNVVNGIRWVVAYENKRYFSNFAKLLTEKLNNYVFKNNS